MVKKFLVALYQYVVSYLGSHKRTSLRVLEVCVCVCACVYALFGLCLLISSWHYGVKLVFFFPLLCLTSCSHHLAPGFEKQAKSLPPGWHENIPASTQPSCRSLLSQLPNVKVESRAVEYRGLLWVSISPLMLKCT